MRDVFGLAEDEAEFGFRLLHVLDGEPGLTLRVHPAHLITADVRLALELYHEYTGGMAAGALPAAGGAMDQPACLFRAFAIIRRAYARRPKRKSDS